MGNMVVAQEPFAASLDGVEVLIRAGDIFDSDHELVKRTPAEWWKSIEVRFAVEAASASPGEKRAARVRVKEAAPVE